MTSARSRSSGIVLAIGAHLPARRVLLVAAAYAITEVRELAL